MYVISDIWIIFSREFKNSQVCMSIRWLRMIKDIMKITI